MEKEPTTSYSRRSFLKVSAITGGGMLLGIEWLSAAASDTRAAALGLEGPAALQTLNSFIQIGSDNVIKIMAQNPEFGQNVTTSLPMIVAEELDANWDNVVVEQAAYDTSRYTRQMAGGSQSVRNTWKRLREAGAAARQMLQAAAAQTWQVPVEEVTTKMGVISHEKSGKSATYGQMAATAATMPVPKEPKLKDVKKLDIVRTSRKNVEGKNIVTGKPMFGLDFRTEGMLVAMIVAPPAFGLQLKSYNAKKAKKMPGIADVFTIDVFPKKFKREIFDTRTFNKRLVIVGNSTWEVMQARKEILAEWEPIETKVEEVDIFGRKVIQTTPTGLESTEGHTAKMQEMAQKPAKELRKDGDPDTAFKNAAQIIERTYSAPFLAHNTMEPMNCFAHVTKEKALFVGPVQTPEFAEKTLAKRLKMPLEKVDIQMTRMGGGFGRRAYCQYMVEAGLISKKAKKPIKLVYSREDDMTYGIYRPAYTATYRAALDENKNLVAFHVKGGGIPEHPVSANRFPAGAVDNYLAEGWEIASNITIGAFRAPRSNFIAAAEQSFLDELAEAMGKDPIDLRLELLQRAKDKPVGKDNDYDAERYAGVLRLAREKSGWDKPENRSKFRGVAAYFCHNSYAAHVIELRLQEGQPVVDRVTSAVDCGIVINPDAAINMVEGAVIDGIGNAFYGNMPFKDGKPEHNNLSTYRIIRMHEIPKAVDVHFVQNDVDPTGLGEPPFPPVFGALANALYKATGKRFYQQPFQLEEAAMEEEG
jgi:isoquinoline 1-oxidoreductase subunit beta